jgi:hypothetical protein
MEKLMFIFKVYLVDKRECRIIQSKEVIAVDEQMAMLEIENGPSFSAGIKSGIFAIFAIRVAEFTQYVD